MSKQSLLWKLLNIFSGSSHNKTSNENQGQTAPGLKETYSDEVRRVVSSRNVKIMMRLDDDEPNIQPSTECTSSPSDHK